MHFLQSYLEACHRSKPRFPTGCLVRGFQFASKNQAQTPRLKPLTHSSRVLVQVNFRGKLLGLEALHIPSFGLDLVES